MRLERYCKLVLSCAPLPTPTQAKEFAHYVISGGLYSWYKHIRDSEPIYFFLDPAVSMNVVIKADSVQLSPRHNSKASTEEYRIRYGTLQLFNQTFGVIGSYYTDPPDNPLRRDVRLQKLLPREPIIWDPSTAIRYLLPSEVLEAGRAVIKRDWDPADEKAFFVATLGMLRVISTCAPEKK